LSFLARHWKPFDLPVLLGIIKATNPNMPKLVVLSEGYTGQTYELKAEKTTVGRLDDNAFQIPDPSVSSHHCEIILKGEEVLIRDLNSTNGSFINSEQITEAMLKPGQVVRFGQIDVRLEATQPVGPSGKKILDKTMVIPQGVKLGDLEKGSGSTVVFDKGSPFQKKSNKANKIFIALAVVLGLVVIGFLAYAIIGVLGKSE
jgi:pSer/pThr/pTyr-binding forkhead associated (FHA) protein